MAVRIVLTEVVGLQKFRVLVKDNHQDTIQAKYHQPSARSVLSCSTRNISEMSSRRNPCTNRAQANNGLAECYETSESLARGSPFGAKRVSSPESARRWCRIIAVDLSKWCRALAGWLRHGATIDFFAQRARRDPGNGREVQRQPRYWQRFTDCPDCFKSRSLRLRAADVFVLRFRHGQWAIWDRLQPFFAFHCPENR